MWSAYASQASCDTLDFAECASRPDGARPATVGALKRLRADDGSPSLSPRHKAFRASCAAEDSLAEDSNASCFAEDEVVCEEEEVAGEEEVVGGEARATGGAASLCCAEMGMFDDGEGEGDADEACSTGCGGQEHAAPAAAAAPGRVDAAPGAAGDAAAAAGCARAPGPPALDPELADMLSVMHDCEAELRISSSYLERHDARACGPALSLDPSMRKIAISWLVEVALEFGLHQETLFLAASTLDRFLSVAKAVPRTQLQLVAVACMLIASKHEEEEHPSVVDFTSIANNCFTTADLRRMEAIVLGALGFRVNAPTLHSFLSLYKQALGLGPRPCALACYFTELAMLEYGMLAHRPSMVAAAAVLLAKSYFGELPGAGDLSAVTSYTPDALLPCMRQLLALQREAWAASDYAAPCVAVRDKYRSPQWLAAATVTPFEAELFEAAPSPPKGGAGGGAGAAGAAPPARGALGSS